MLPLQVRLQLFRGLAALVVVIHHTVYWSRTTPEWTPLQTFFLALFPGPVVVTLFFLLSGYLTTALHQQEFNQPRHLLRFLWRRFTRLYPAYWAMSLIAVALAASGFYSWDSNWFKIQTPWDYVLAISVFPEPGTMPLAFLCVGWSLFYEILFYGFIALAFLYWPVAAILATVTLVFCYWGLPGVHWLPEFPDYRLLCFVPGVLGAFLLPRVKLPKLLCHAGWIGGLIFFVTIQFLHLNFKCQLLAGSLLILSLAALDLHYPLTKPTGWIKALTGLGTISYSLYLCHMPVQTVLHAIVGIPNVPWKWLLYNLAPLPVAWLAYRHIEKPVINWAKKIGPA